MPKFSDYPLPAGHTISVTVAGGSVSVRQVEDSSIVSIATFGSPATFGPYLLDRTFRIDGVATVTIAESDPVANIPTDTQLANIPTADEKAILDGIPTTDPADDGVSVWSDDGALKTSGASV